MRKKIAVVIRNRQDEAVRMSMGLTLMDDRVDVFLLNTKLTKTKHNALNIDTLGDLDIKIYSNVEGDAQSTYLPTAVMAKDLLLYDHILPY